MHRIVFTSRASQALTREDIEKLREHAAAANEREKMTGLFLFDGSRFLLALEGPEVPLLKLMRKIYADKRHYDIVFILSEKAQTRQFPHWAMSQTFSFDENDRLDLLEQVKRELSMVSNVEVKAHFFGFTALARTTRTWV